MNYYDTVLLLVPLVFAAVAGVAMLFGLSGLAAPVAGMTVLPLVGHALFVRAPGADSRPASGDARNTGLQAAD